MLYFYDPKESTNTGRHFEIFQTKPPPPPRGGLIKERSNRSHSSMLSGIDLVGQKKLEDEGVYCALSWQEVSTAVCLLFNFQLPVFGRVRGGEEWRDLISRTWELWQLFWRTFSKMLIKHNGWLVDNWLFCVVCSLKICSSFGPVVPWDLHFLSCFPPINSALFESKPTLFYWFQPLNCLPIFLRL